MGKKSQRLGQEDWIKAGFRALVAGGDNALKVEPLARALETTKGSFYWHFKDLPTFEAALLAYWQDKALHGPIAEVAGVPDPFERLMRLADIAGQGPGDEHGGDAAEPAIRAYARTRPKARIIVDQVDRARLEWLAENMKAAGAKKPHEAAHIVYAAVIGLDFLPSQSNDNASRLRKLIRAFVVT